MYKTAFSWVQRLWRRFSYGRYDRAGISQTKVKSREQGRDRAFQREKKESRPGGDWTGPELDQKSGKSGWMEKEAA